MEQQNNYSYRQNIICHKYKNFGYYKNEYWSNNPDNRYVHAKVVENNGKMEETILLF